MPTDTGRGLDHVIRAFGWSMQGFRAALQHEAAFRMEALLFVLLAPVGVLLGASGVERALLVGSLMVVLVAELLNSGIEAAVDRIGEEHHPLSGRAKDVGSAAVFVALTNVGLTWGFILYDRFLA